MSSTLSRLIPVLFMLATLSASADAAGAPHPVPHVRTTNRDVARLIAQATTESALVRSLVARLDASDVVVYVRTTRTLPYPLDGQLTFVGTGGGVRYVVVSLALRRQNLRLMATLGHELQHAVEVAEHPEIVDSPSLARTYTDLGFATVRGAGRTFDTRAARRAGEQVYAEITHGTRTLAMLSAGAGAQR